MFLYICFGVACAVIFVWWCLKIPSPRRIRPLIELVEDSNISELAVNRWGKKIVIRQRSQRRAVPSPPPQRSSQPHREEEVKKAAPAAAADGEYLLEKWRYLVHRLPRNQNIETWIPKLIRINGKPHVLRPIIAHLAGTFEYTRVEYDEINVPGSARNLWYYDFLTTGELVGRITQIDGTTVEVRSPGPGHIIGFQVLPGTPVQEGDIIMLIAQKKEDSR